MKPQDFVREYIRLCDAYRLPQEFACKKDCPFNEMGCSFSKNVNINQPERFEKAYNIVEKWSDTHPVKTRQSEFLKQFPGASVTDGTLDIRPCIIEKSVKCIALEGGDCDDCRRKYWLTEVTDND